MKEKQGFTMTFDLSGDDLPSSKKEDKRSYKEKQLDLMREQVVALRHLADKIQSVDTTLSLIFFLMLIVAVVCAIN